MKPACHDPDHGTPVRTAGLDLTGGVAAPVTRDRAAELFRIVDAEGALLIRDTGLRTAQEFAEFLRAIDFRARPYIGGVGPRTEYAPGVYTATDLLHDISLPLHQEMTYLDDAPDYVVFFCQEPTLHGQKTNLIGDMRKLTQQLPAGFKERYRGKRARLCLTLPTAGRSTGVYQAKESWQATFGTDDHGEAQAIGRRRGWELAWNEEDNLTIMQEPARFFRFHPIHGELWCSQAHFVQPEARRLTAQRDGRRGDVERWERAMASAPESLDRMIMEDGTPIPRDDCRIWFELAASLETAYSLGRGEVIILDNMVTAHGRTKFTGPRQIFVALGDRSRG